MQNKPNFPRFSTKSEDRFEKQTQFKPIQSQFYHPKGDLPNLPEYLILYFTANKTKE